MIDRLVMAEQQIATSLAMVGALNDSVNELRKKVSGLSAELEEMRKVSSAALQSFEEMRKPLQGLLDLKQRISGGWLVVVALGMAVSYLLQPLLKELYHLRLG
jgi:methyl-accepting chemotaxis protein